MGINKFDDSGIDLSILQKIKIEAKRTGSDAVFISYQGQVLLKDYSTQEPIQLMSCVKPVISLLIGCLIEEGKLDSIEEFVSEYYPEWKQGMKHKITIRHLLNHTSGLQNVANAGKEIYPAPDVIQLALAAELDAEPGTEFSYNNKAVNLLSGLIEIISGMKMNEYAQFKLFDPLEIEDVEFYYDKVGNPHSMAGMTMRAHDFAKIGKLILLRVVMKNNKLLLRTTLKLCYIKVNKSILHQDF